MTKDRVSAREVITETFNRGGQPKPHEDWILADTRAWSIMYDLQKAGYAIVPIEPSEKRMDSAVDEIDDEFQFGPGEARTVYSAMLHTALEKSK